jgi:flagellar protein FliO/FliZ
MPEAQVVLVPESEIILGEALPETPESGGRQIFVIIRMVLVLALAAAAVYGVVYFLRRSARPQTQRNPHLKILTSAHLGSNRYVYVVSVGVKAWLIGAGEGGVNLISEVEDQEAVDAMLLDESRAAAEAGASRFADFKALLRRLGGGGGPPGTISRNGFSTETLRKQRERLKGL